MCWCNNVFYLTLSKVTKTAQFLFKNYLKLAGPPGAARDYFTISLWKSPVQIDLRSLRALGWGEPPTNKIFYIQTHTEEQLLFAGPRPILKAYPPIW